MPASTQAIMKNVERMSGDAALTAYWTREATKDRTIGQAWLAFIAAADAAGIADRIPGSVGRKYRAKYAEQPTTREAVAKATARAASRKATTKKATTKTTARKATK